jgi:hypothetical protein
MISKIRGRSPWRIIVSLWKDADPDIPILKEAKVEYAKLQENLKMWPNQAVPRQNLVHSWNEGLADELDATYFDKILVMILATVTSLRHLLGWVVSAFRS